MFKLVRDPFVKAQSKPDFFEKALVLLKTINEYDYYFQNLVATLKKIKREFARDLD